MATAVLDTSLLANLEGCDMVARKVKYHSQCMVKLKNRHRSLERKEEEADRINLEDQIAEDQVFVELVSYMKETTSEGGPKLFKLSDLAHLYNTCLVQLNELTNEFISITLKDVLIGIVASSCPLLNYFLLIAKIYIWDCRRTHTVPNINGFRLK